AGAVAGQRVRGESAAVADAEQRLQGSLNDRTRGRPVRPGYEADTAGVPFGSGVEDMVQTSLRRAGNKKRRPVTRAFLRVRALMLVDRWRAPPEQLREPEILGAVPEVDAEAAAGLEVLTGAGAW